MRCSWEMCWKSACGFWLLAFNQVLFTSGTTLPRVDLEATLSEAPQSQFLGPTENPFNLWSRGIVTPPWRPIISASESPVDLVFLIDGSGSVRSTGLNNFRKVQQWIKQVAGAFDISNKAVQIGVVQYSHWLRNRLPKEQAYLKTEVSLGECRTARCFNSQVDKIRLMGYTTYTGAAINKTVNEDFSASAAGTKKILVLLTDGRSGDIVRFAAAQARNTGVTIFCVGVGAYDISQLQIIANGELGNNLRIYEPGSFSRLSSTVQNLQREIKAVYISPVCTPLIPPIHGKLSCSKTNEVGSVCTFSCFEEVGYTMSGSQRRTCVKLPNQRPQWTGKTTTCGFCSNAFDLLVILDSSSSVGQRNFLIMKDFALRLIDTFEIGRDQVQTSIMRYNRRVFDLWQYDTYLDKDKLLQAIMGIVYNGTGTFTGKALEYAVRNKFDVASGRRNDKPHLTVVLTDGRTLDTISDSARRLHKMSHVIAIGANNAVQKELNVIASDPDEVYSHNVGSNFAALLTIIRDISIQLCRAQKDVAEKKCNPPLDLSPCLSVNCTNGNRAGSVCNVRCCRGYAMRGEPIATCNYDGNWSTVGLECEKINYCNADICQNSGTCISLLETYKCICPDGFTGSNCESNINECYSNPCINNGSCTDGINEYECTCTFGYEGPNCEVAVDWCQSNPCEHEATCRSSPASGYACSCNEGFTGRRCEQDIDECMSRPCGNRGTCHNLDGTYECFCLPGYEGLHCTTDVNECSPNPCQNGGVCNETTIGNYSCSCPHGYTGTHCEVDHNDCLPNPCQHNGKCTDYPGSFTCQCALGFTGSDCGLEIDYCEGNPCHNGGTCFNEFHSFYCSCAPHFTGFNCKVDLRLDRSFVPSCLNGGTWNKTINRCVCQSGFEGERCQNATIVCSPIRPVANETIRCDGNGGLGTKCVLSCSNDTVPKMWKKNPGSEPTRTCTTSGQWSGPSVEQWGCEEPSCPQIWTTETFDSVDGSERDLTLTNTRPAMISNAAIHFANCTNERAVGSTCIFSCKSEYEMRKGIHSGEDQGPITSTCRRDGTWSGPPGRCVKVRCEPPVNDVGIYEPLCNNGHKAGSFCINPCPHPFGSLVKTCTLNLTWEPPAPWNCEATSCPGPPPQTFNGVYECTNNLFTLGTNCNSRCLSGYEETQPGRYECVTHQNTLRWKGNSGICRQVRCEHRLDLSTGSAVGFGTESYVHLAVPPTLDRPDSTASFAEAPRSCNKQALLALNNSENNITIDLWYGASTIMRSHLEVGNNGTNRVSQNQQPIQISAYQDHLLTFSWKNLSIFGLSLPVPTSKPGVFQPHTRVTLMIRNGFVDISDNRGWSKTIGPSTNFSTQHKKPVYVALNRLIAEGATGLGLCTVCINSRT